MSITVPIGTRYRTGQTCQASGHYRFDDYLDGTSYPPPHPHERDIPLSARETFPPIHSSNKGCWWKLIQHL